MLTRKLIILYNSVIFSKNFIKIHFRNSYIRATSFYNFSYIQHSAGQFQNCPVLNLPNQNKLP